VKRAGPKREEPIHSMIKSATSAMTLQALGQSAVAHLFNDLVGKLLEPLGYVET